MDINTINTLNNASSNINNYDASVIGEILLNFNTDNGLMATGNYQNASNIVQSTVESVFGTNDVNDAAYRLALFSTLQQYLNETNQFVVLNDLANNNNYVAETLLNETERVGGIKDKMRNTTYKKQNEYFQKRYVIEYNGFVKNIVKYLILLSIFIIIITSYYLKDKISKFIFYLIVSVSTVLSFLVILLYVKNTQTRRKDDWNKYYFVGMKTDETSSSCTPPLTTSESVL